MTAKIDNRLLDVLTAKAKVSPRLRMNLDLRNSSKNGTQRLLDALEPRRIAPAHRHQKALETVVYLRVPEDMLY